MRTAWTDGDRERLASAVVGVAGAGGLGSNCAMALARSGVGKLVVLDMDAVERANLNRQAFDLSQVGKSKVRCLKENIERSVDTCKVVTVERRYGSSDAVEIFSGCSVIVEAFDSPEYKAALIGDVLSNMPGVYVVSGSGIAGIGGNSSLKTVRTGNLFLVGDGVTEALEGVPLLAPRVVAVASLQANMVLSLLLGDEEV